VADEAFRVATEHHVFSLAIPDTRAVETICKFAGPLFSFSCYSMVHLVNTDDHRFLVEPACAAGLAAAYTPGLLQELEVDAHILERARSGECSGIVLVVCGGSSVTLDLLAQWRKKVGLDG
jgi:L-serine/L-threonine ammonia-lyase